MSRAAGTSMASPGSRKARCMSTTRSALLPGMSLRADSKVSARFTVNSALGNFSTGSPGPLPVYSVLGSPSAAPRTIYWAPSSSGSLVPCRLRCNQSVSTDSSSGAPAFYRFRSINSALGSPSAHLELPCPHRKGVGDVADGLDAALVVDDDSDHVEAAGLLAETLRAQVALGELAELVLLARVHGRLGRRRVLQIAPGLDLDEDEGLALLRHQVDLTHACPDVLLQDGVPATGQEAGGLVLPFDA